MNFEAASNFSFSFFFFISDIFSAIVLILQFVLKILQFKGFMTETFTVMNVMILDLFSDKTISYLLQMKSAERITVWLV